jgi:hypothetical protein
VVALQGEAANHRELRRVNAWGGERRGKGGLSARQVWTGKASDSESP